MTKIKARLWDMRDAARAAVEFTRDLRFEDFLSDRKTRNAVERNLEIIGEAARSLSQKVRDEHPEIRWRSIIALRNVIAHEYGEIRYENIWRICASRLPQIIAYLDRLGLDD